MRPHSSGIFCRGSRPAGSTFEPVREAGTSCTEQPSRSEGVGVAVVSDSVLRSPLPEVELAARAPGRRGELLGSIDLVAGRAVYVRQWEHEHRRAAVALRPVGVLERDLRWLVNRCGLGQFAPPDRFPIIFTTYRSSSTVSTPISSRFAQLFPQSHFQGVPVIGTSPTA